MLYLNYNSTFRHLYHNGAVPHSMVYIIGYKNIYTTTYVNTTVHLATLNVFAEFLLVVQLWINNLYSSIYITGYLNTTVY